MNEMNPFAPPEAPMEPEAQQTTLLNYCGFLRRFFAKVIDYAIVLTPPALLAKSAYAPVVNGLAATTLVMLVYYGVLVVVFGGTPGKLLLGLRIRAVDGRPIGVAGALLRLAPVFALILAGRAAHAFGYDDVVDRRTAGFIFLGWLAIDAGWMATNAERRTVHDLAAGSVVVYWPPRPMPPPQPVTFGYCAGVVLIMVGGLALLGIVVETVNGKPAADSGRIGAFGIIVGMILGGINLVNKDRS